MTTSLVVLDTARRPMFSVGDPVTVSLATSYDVADNVTSCARVMRIVPGTVFVKVIGLNVPAPYRVGDTVPIDTNKVIDW